MNEELHDRLKCAKNLGNIGNLYRNLKDYTKAMDYLGRALNLNKELGNFIGQTNNLSDMGTISAELKEYDAAMAYFVRAQKVAEESGDEEGVAIVLGNKGNIYTEQKEVEKAVAAFEESLKINEKLGRLPGIVTNLVNLAALHYKIATDSSGKVYRSRSVPAGKHANLEKAINYYKQAIPMYEQVGHLEGLYAVYGGLSDCYAAEGRYKPALEALDIAGKLNDSIRTTDGGVKLAQLGEERAELEKKQQEELTQLAQNKRRNEAILFSIGIALLIGAIVHLQGAQEVG